jgi:hypothetical protein
MLRLWRAIALTVGMVSLGTLGIQGTAYAVEAFNPIIDCNFTVTAAGNGMPVWTKNFGAVDFTLQTGQVFDLFNQTTSRGNTFYWNEESFGQTGDWYPTRTVDVTATYMLKDQNSCSIDNE